MIGQSTWMFTPMPLSTGLSALIRPHLLTTVIGQASVAAESIDHFLNNLENKKRPKIDVHHFDLLNKLRETDMAPEHFDKEGDEHTRGIDRGVRGTEVDNFSFPAINDPLLAREDFYNNNKEACQPDNCLGHQAGT